MTELHGLARLAIAQIQRKGSSLSALFLTLGLGLNFALAEPPNMYECKAKDGKSFNYSSSSFAGNPLLGYQVGKKSFSADFKSIKVAAGVMGRWAQGRLDDGRLLSLLLDKGPSMAVIEKQGKKEFFTVDCTAESVVF